MTHYYLDSSVAMRFLLGQEPRLPVWGRWERAYSSELLGLECRRAIDRLRLGGEIDDQGVLTLQSTVSRIERSLGIIALTRPVLRRAALPMGTPVGTLDAIHLASALLFEEQRQVRVIFATHDVRQATAAGALGFEVLGI